MKMINFNFILIFTLLFLPMGCSPSSSGLPPHQAVNTIPEETWNYYKNHFISPDGRVMRLQDGDTVSEGQAYAMLRAVWMKDQFYFDRVYRWTEKNLSRQRSYGDPLLSWHWKNGRVTDPMPAADADLDYAFSLVLAEKLWAGRNPTDLQPYGEKAQHILEAILRLETFRLPSGRLYLSPWILSEPETVEQFPQNPSYYSPAYFRIFQTWTGDSRWNELVMTTYSLLSGFQTFGNAGLVPDWCQIDREGKISALPGKSFDFGWDAVRMPFRIAWDDAWFHSRKAHELLVNGLKPFIEKNWKENRKFASGYNLAGRPINSYENALFYAAYSCVLTTTESVYQKDIQEKTRSFLMNSEEGLFYSDPDEYFTNSLAWLSEVVSIPPEAISQQKA